MSATQANRIRTVIAAVALLGASCAEANVESDEPGEQHALFAAGDLLQYGVPLAGLALTFALQDHNALPGDHPGALSWTADGFADALRLVGSPRHDFLASALRMELTTYSLKFAVPEQRPNGGQQSFPSGHTASAFMGAEFIRKEYGWGWGTPAYLAASYVGWSRVASDNHWTHDVIAGAAIGILSNHDFGEFSNRFGTISIVPALLPTGGSSRNPGFDAVDDSLGTAGVGLKLQMIFGGSR